MADEARVRALSRLEGVAGRGGVNGSVAAGGPAGALERNAGLLAGVLAAATGADGVAGTVTGEQLGAALSLLEGMRIELDRLETQVVIEARRRGMDWKVIAPFQGLGSSQAASQRFQRLVARLEEIRQGVR